MKNLYIASSLYNAERIRRLIDRFQKEGINITYNWTIHGQVYSEEELTKFGIKEEQGIHECDVFLLVFPGRNGAHFEMGYARAAGKHIVLLEEVEVEQKTFYYLPDIVRFKEEDDAVQHILNYLDNIQISPSPQINEGMVKKGGVNKKPTTPPPPPPKGQAGRRKV